MKTSEMTEAAALEAFVLDDSGRKADYERFLRMLAERRAERAAASTARQPAPPTPPADSSPPDR